MPSPFWATPPPGVRVEGCGPSPSLTGSGQGKQGVYYNLKPWYLDFMFLPGLVNLVACEAGAELGEGVVEVKTPTLHREGKVVNAWYFSA